MMVKAEVRVCRARYRDQGSKYGAQRMIKTTREADYPEDTSHQSCEYCDPCRMRKFASNPRI